MKKVFSFISELILDLFIGVLIAFLVTKFLIFPCSVVGTSMQPTLRDNDRGISLAIKKYFKINRFDICVLQTDTADKMIVKRVIGLPGEIIEYKDNKLYINGEYLEETFLGDVTTDDFTYHLADDEYYCLGDNRNVSKDSRYYGAFKKENFVSTAMFIIYPFDNFGVKK